MTLVQQKVQALTFVDEPLFNFNGKRMAELALKHKLPMIARTDHAEAGGLMGYGVDISDLWFRAASMVDKILKGARPHDMPVERATKFEFTVNLKTAKAFGLQIPQPILLRAEKVIE